MVAASKIITFGSLIPQLPSRSEDTAYMRIHVLLLVYYTSPVLRFLHFLSRYTVVFLVSSQN
jgi:hypothetical protein